MLFIPDNALAEVQPMLLEVRWVVAEVRVPAPDVEPRPGTSTRAMLPNQASSRRSNSCPTRSRWPSGRSLGLAASSASVSTSPDGGPRPSTGGASSLGTMTAQLRWRCWNVARPSRCRRVGVAEMDRLAIEQPVEVLGFGAVTQSSRCSPSIHSVAGLVIASSGGGGISSGSHSPAASRGRAASPTRPGRTRATPDRSSSPAVQPARSAAVPGSTRRSQLSCCRRCGGLHLLRRQPASHVYRHLGQPQRLRRLEPRVPDDDHARLVDDDRLAKAELPNRLRDHLDRVIVQSRVLVIRLRTVHGQVSICMRELQRGG